MSANTHRLDDASPVGRLGEETDVLEGLGNCQNRPLGFEVVGMVLRGSQNWQPAIVDVAIVGIKGDHVSLLEIDIVADMYSLAVLAPPDPDDAGQLADGDQCRVGCYPPFLGDVTVDTGFPSRHLGHIALGHEDDVLVRVVVYILGVEDYPPGYHTAGDGLSRGNCLAYAT